MREKYLPIGSVVSVKNINKKVMIIGYYSLEYQNSVKIYDYVGCTYPEGMLLKNSIFSFNHSDIIEVEFVGLVDDTYKVLNNNLNAQLTQSNEEMMQPNSFVNLKFDENGVVVYEEISNVKKAPELISRASVTNPFEVNNATMRENAARPKINAEFKFDENGVVTEDPTVAKNTEEIESKFHYTFDENGVVTTDSVDQLNEDISNKPIYQFDENGFVIADGTDAINTSTEGLYEFDNVGGASVVETNSNKDVIDDFVVPHYSFDENGVIISD